MPTQTRRPDAILVRHFPSPLNERKVSRGWLSVGIDKEEAAKLAPNVAKALERYGVDSLISSDLPRAEESMKLIAKEMDGDVETEATPRLRTWNTGSAAGKKESETIPLRQKYIRNAEIPIPGGESFGDDFIDGRYRPELKDIVKRRKAGEELAFIAHGHHLLAAPHILRDEDDVDASKLPTLDENFPPGGVWGFFIEGKNIRIDRLDKQENKDA